MMNTATILNFPVERVKKTVSEEYASEVILMLEPEDFGYGAARSLIRTACGLSYYNFN